MTASETSTEESAKFTPGPWETAPRFGVYALVQTPGGYPVAITDILPRSAGVQAEQEANARLIAAAPDLYEALRPLAECEIIEADVPLRDSDSARYFITMGEIRAARAALAKARGQ